jgi:hypothetical protein
LPILLSAAVVPGLVAGARAAEGPGIILAGAIKAHSGKEALTQYEATALLRALC